jgi:hypothetical protein
MSDTRQKTLSFIGILGAFLVVALLVWAMKLYTRPAPLDAARAGERRKALAELRAANEAGLNRYGWVDQSKGLVRLRIDRAIELTLEEYKNPAAARSNLTARAIAANPPPPPPAPNKYE